MYQDRLPPYSIEAEEAVLGSILLDPSVMAKLSLEADAFFVEKNRQTYVACLKLHKEGKAIDQITVAHELARQGKLASDEGLLLARLINNTPTSLHAEYYAGILVEMQGYRKLIAAGQRISELGYGQGEDALKAACEVVLAIKTSSRPFLRTPKEIGEMGYERYIELRQGSDKTLLPTGFYDLDSVLGGLRWGEMTILAARPGLGKSTLAWDIARHIVNDLESNVLWCSAEMLVEQILDREVASHIGQPIQTIWKGKYSEDLEHDILDAIGAICIARVFAFGAKKGSPMHDPNVVLEEGYQYDGSISVTSLQHFYDKILKIKPESFKTPIAREMATERYKYVIEFVQRFEKEWIGEM